MSFFSRSLNVATQNSLMSIIETYKKAFAEQLDEELTAICRSRIDALCKEVMQSTRFEIETRPEGGYRLKITSDFLLPS